jgi:hypothetical protein
LRTPLGEAIALLNDIDIWGRYRVTGIGTPPFPTGHAASAQLPNNQTTRTIHDKPRKFGVRAAIED